MKIDKRRFYFITIDTETANNMDNPLVFDIGGAIHDKQGNVMETFSFIVKEVFYGMPDLMAECFYQSKLPMYRAQIEQGFRQVKSWYEVRTHVHKLCDKYSVKAIIAHNMQFDYRSTNTTQRYLTYSKYRYFFPKNVPLWDTLSMARDTIVKQKTYIRFCEDNGYCTKNGKPRATAEILYRYITNNVDFTESHTGLEDVLIEKEIFVKCIRQHKKMKRSPWK